jgi:O-antigen/teichoic acid export membrane protein
VFAAVAVLGAAVWHESSNRTIGAFYLARGRAEYGLVSESVSAVLRLVLVSALLATGGRLVAVASGYAAASAVTVAGLATWAYRAGFRPMGPGVPGEARGLFREAAAFAIYGLLFQTYFRIDVVLLGVLRPGADVGQYVAAFRVIDTLLAVPAVLTGALYPVLSRLDGAGSREAFARACAEATRWLAVIGFGLSLAAGTAALPVLRVIAGQGYEPAAWYLQLLLPAFVFICLSAVGLLALNAVRQQRWNVWVMLAGAVLKVAWNVVLVPRYGVPAACVGSVVTGAVIAASLVTVSRPWYPALDWCRACAGAAFAGASAVVAALAASRAPVGVRFGVSLLVFVGVALAVRALRPDDLATIRGLWRLRDSAAPESSR